MKCKECGSDIELHWTKDTNKRLSEEQLCFTCNFWVEHIEDDKLRDNTFVIDGCHYFVANENNNSSFRGCGGQKFHISSFDGRIITTTNLWVQGEIPERFRDRMPDNAKFIKEVSDENKS